MTVALSSSESWTCSRTSRLIWLRRSTRLVLIIAVRRQLDSNTQSLECKPTLLARWSKSSERRLFSLSGYLDTLYHLLNMFIYRTLISNLSLHILFHHRWYDFEKLIFWWMFILSIQKLKIKFDFKNIPNYAKFFIYMSWINRIWDQAKLELYKLNIW